ncbi:MFS transporter [Streptomyces sp. B6B3]|uniref:MFS transporter n=1 Tax=Streptomyces sp. B6B3 TaxID=3153570 RepID=UPI00325D3640
MTAGEGPAGAEDGGGGHTSLALGVISAAQLMFLLDSTIVNVSLPGIQDSLDVSGSGLEWVVASYSVAFGGLLMLGGRMGDILGRRRMFLVGVATFTAASLLGGFAVEAWQLIGMRILQGVGAAAASPAALSLIAVTFPEGSRRDRAVAWYTAVATAGGGAGLLAGGLINDHLSWRWVMFVNVPVGVVILAAGARVLRETPRIRGTFDATGALTGTLAALLLIYGLIEGASGGGDGWTTPHVLAALVTAALLVPLFAVVERRARQPLMPLHLVTDRVRFAAYAVAVCTSTSMFGIFFFLTLFLQDVWDYSPTHTALVYLPLTVLLVVGARASAPLAERFGARGLVCAGLLVSGAGMLWLARIGDSGGYLTGMLVPTVLTYVGLSVTGVPLTLAALARVPHGDTGAASGLLTTSRQIGGATGLAVLGTVVWASAGASDGTVSDAALSTAIGHGFAVAAGATLLSVLVALAALPGKPAHPAPPGLAGEAGEDRGTG